MKILALELSSARGSIAALNATILSRDWANNSKHSGLFFENIARVQREFGTPEKIIVGLGPGSYAGTRIAISTAIGLQIASKAQLIGFPSICAMDSDEEEYCVIGDARRQSFLFARIRANNLMEGPTLFSEAELRDKIDNLEKKMSIFASEKLPRFERAIVCYPSALVLARLAQDANRNFCAPPLEPIYLREPHITIPKR